MNFHRTHFFSSKPPPPFAAPATPIVLPAHYPEEIDYEVELAVVVGKTARFVPPERAGDFILGYTVANDVSNRAAQFKDGQWARGKSYDTFCPVGPVIATGLDGDRLALACRIDGQEMQSSNTADMIFFDPPDPFLHLRMHDPAAGHHHFDGNPGRRRFSPANRRYFCDPATSWNAKSKASGSCETGWWPAGCKRTAPPKTLKGSRSKRTLNTAGATAPRISPAAPAKSPPAGRNR